MADTTMATSTFSHHDMTDAKFDSLIFGTADDFHSALNDEVPAIDPDLLNRPASPASAEPTEYNVAFSPFDDGESTTANTPDAFPTFVYPPPSQPHIINFQPYGLRQRSISEPPTGLLHNRILFADEQRQQPPPMTFSRDGCFIGEPQSSSARAKTRTSKRQQRLHPYKSAAIEQQKQQRGRPRRTNTGPTSQPAAYGNEHVGFEMMAASHPLSAGPSRVCTPKPEEEVVRMSPAPSGVLVAVSVDELRSLIAERVRHALQEVQAGQRDGVVGAVAGVGEGEYGVA